MNIKLYKHTITLLTDSADSGEALLEDLDENLQEWRDDDKVRMGRICFTAHTKKQVKVVDDK